MFKFFSSDHAASISENRSTTDIPKETLPGGPAPDPGLPWHSEPINRPQEESTAPCPPPRHPSRRLSMANTSANHPHEQPPSDAHRENGPTAADTDRAAMESSVGGEARRLTSVASRRTNRNRVIDRASGDDVLAYSAVPVMNEIPNVDLGLQSHAAGAEENLGQQEKAAIGKEQHGIGRRLSKVIKNESKAEQATLDVAVKELEGLQKLQKVSIKEEALSRSRHSHALNDAHKAEMQLLAARIAHERGQAGQRATGQALEASRRHVRETTDMLHEKIEEIERLRIQKQVDDRERAIKVKSLVGEERKRLGRLLRS